MLAKTIMREDGMHSASWRGCSERDGQVRERSRSAIKGVDRRGSYNWHWIGIALALFYPVLILYNTVVSNLVHCQEDFE
jgi:hypothetical protein